MRISCGVVVGIMISLLAAVSYSDITVFSFHPVKIVTTAEGGAALTNQKDLADVMALLRSHGITRILKWWRKHLMVAGTTNPDWLGFNYRMTELQAALGVNQMQHLDDFVTARHVC